MNTRKNKKQKKDIMNKIKFCIWVFCNYDYLVNKILKPLADYQNYAITLNQTYGVNMVKEGTKKECMAEYAKTGGSKTLGEAIMKAYLLYNECTK